GNGDRSAMSVLTDRPPPTGLPLRVLLLGLQAPQLGTARWLRGPARLRRVQRLQHHLPQLLPAVLDVYPLVARPLTLNDQPSLRRETAALQGAQALLHVVGQRRVGGQVPVQDRLARHLVDVLSPGPAGAREREVQLVVGNR